MTPFECEDHPLFLELKDHQRVLILYAHGESPIGDVWQWLVKLFNGSDPKPVGTARSVSLKKALDDLYTDLLVVKSVRTDDPV